MKLVFVREVVLEVAVGSECFWAEGTPVASRELTKETVEVELTERRSGVSTALTMKEGKVARVHLGPLNLRTRRGLIQSLACRGVGHVLVDEVCLEAISVFERFGAEEAVVAWLVLASVSVVVGPARFGGDK
jgi:hypothetical protein